MIPDQLLQEFMLALCIYREARGESLLGKALVAQTIVNRTTDLKKRWPRTIQGVVCQPMQFSSFNKNDPNVTVYPKEGEAVWADCVTAAREAIDATPPITDANHYLTTALLNSPGKPAWADPAKVIQTEGNHAFLEL